MQDTKPIDWSIIERQMAQQRNIFMKSNHFHLFNLEQLQARFDEGERTPELAEEIGVFIENDF